MNVIALTVLCSLLLAGLFAALFVWDRTRNRTGSAEQAALRPLEEERSSSKPAKG